MAVEQGIGQVRLDRTRGQLVGLLFVAGGVSAAFGVDRGGKDDGLAPGKRQRRGNARGEVGDFPGLASGHGQRVELGRAAPARHEVECPAVGRPEGRVFRSRIGGQLAHGPRRQVNLVQVGVALGFPEIGRGDLERQSVAGGRQGQPRYSLQPIKVIDGERFLGGCQRRQAGDGQQDEQKQSFHGRVPPRLVIRDS